MYYIGILVIIGIIGFIGIISGKRIRNKAFVGYKGGSVGMVMGALVGTLVGGSSTIGTAQLAFINGFSAWWFTLGGSLGVLLLGLVFAKPLYKENIDTLPEVISKEYGKYNGMLMTLLSSIGTFLSFVAQIISGATLITAITPFSFTQGIFVIALLFIVYVFFGGSLALGYAGMAKTLLLLGTVIVAGAIAVILFPSVGGLFNNPVLPHANYFNLFARGVAKDAGAGISLIIGVTTTQSYIGAILSAKTLHITKRGSVITAIIVPLIGLCAIIIGMYMKVKYPLMDPKMALPVFITEHTPPIISGMMLATLLVAVVGTGAGLSHGMAVMIHKNITSKLEKTNNNTFVRILLLIIIAVGVALCMLNLGDIILNWSFLSMGLRGAVSFLPLITALYMKRKLSYKFVTVSMIMSVVGTIIGYFIFPSNIDPLFAGMGISFIVIIIGMIYGVMKNARTKR